MRSSARVSILALVLGAGGCATAIGTNQPTETLGKGGIHVGASVDVAIPASRIRDALDVAIDVTDKYASDPSYEPTEAEQRTYFDAALGLAVSGVGPINDFQLRYGVADAVDVGLRYTGVALHLEAKVQVLGGRGRGTSGWQAAVTAGYVHALFGGLLFDVLEALQVDDFSRKDFQLGLLVGKRIGDVGHVWLGPKYIIAKVHLDSTLRNVDETLTVDETIHYFGGVGGLALGYAGVFAFAEVAVMNMWASPTVLGQETDIGGIVVMPSVGLMARF